MGDVAGKEPAAAPARVTVRDARVRRPVSQWTIRVLDAGHNPPALLARAGIRRLTTGGPIVGAFADAAFEEETLHLRDRETLVMLTDGVTEARSATDEEFGEERLMACLTADPASSPGVLPNASSRRYGNSASTRIRAMT